MDRKQNFVTLFVTLLSQNQGYNFDKTVTKNTSYKLNINNMNVTLRKRQGNDSIYGKFKLKSQPILIL